MRVRAMQLEDTRIAGQIAQAALGPGWDADSMARELGRGVVEAFVVEAEGEVCALLVGTLVAGEHETLAIATAESARRRGYARALLSHALEQARRRGATAAFLEVRASNHAARGLYSSLGFVDEATRRAYYADGEDACVMAARLEAETPAPR